MTIKCIRALAGGLPCEGQPAYGNSRTLPELQLALEAILAELRVIEWDKADAAHLVPIALSLKSACDFAALPHSQIELRAITNNQLVPGAALKDEIKHRVWNDTAEVEKLAQSQFGDKAFKRTLLSPAGIEKLGSEGKALVAMCSSKPEAGKRVVY